MSSFLLFLGVSFAAAFLFFLLHGYILQAAALLHAYRSFYSEFVFVPDLDEKWNPADSVGFGSQDVLEPSGQLSLYYPPTEDESLQPVVAAIPDFDSGKAEQLILQLLQEVGPRCGSEICATLALRPKKAIGSDEEPGILRNLETRGLVERKSHRHIRLNYDADEIRWGASVGLINYALRKSKATGRSSIFGVIAAVVALSVVALQGLSTVVFGTLAGAVVAACLTAVWTHFQMNTPQTPFLLYSNFGFFFGLLNFSTIWFVISMSLVLSSFAVTGASTQGGGLRIFAVSCLVSLALPLVFKFSKDRATRRWPNPGRRSLIRVLVQRLDEETTLFFANLVSEVTGGITHTLCARKDKELSRAVEELYGEHVLTIVKKCSARSSSNTRDNALGLIKTKGDNVQVRWLFEILGVLGTVNNVLGFRSHLRDEVHRRRRDVDATMFLAEVFGKT